MPQMVILFLTCSTVKFPEITLDEYLEYIRLFFQIKHPFFLKNIPEIYNESILLAKESRKIRKHFEHCKKKFETYIDENKTLLKEKVQDIYKTNKKVLFKINKNMRRKVEIGSKCNVQYSWKKDEFEPKVTSAFCTKPF